VKSEAIITTGAYPTYVAEQRFNQILHKRNKYCNRLDINNTGGNAIQLKQTNLQPALKKLQMKNQGQGLQQFEPTVFGNETQFSANTFVLFLFCDNWPGHYFH